MDEISVRNKIGLQSAEADADAKDRAYVDSLFLDYSAPVNRPTPLIYDPRDSDKMLITRQNLMLIQGLAKSFKSYFCSWMAYAFFCQQQTGKLVYIDTEQGEYHAVNIAHRICNMLGWQYADSIHAGRFRYVALRKMTIDERERAFELICKFERPDLIILDGARDLCREANNELVARESVNMLEKLACEYNMGIACVQHTGKDGTRALGHHGGELDKKSEQRVEVSRVEGKAEFKVHCLPSRNIEFKDMRFRINENGLPELIEEQMKSILPQLGTPKETEALQKLLVENGKSFDMWVGMVQSSVLVSSKTATKYVKDFIANGYLIADDRDGHFYSHYLTKAQHPQPPQINDTQMTIDAGNSMHDDSGSPF